MLGERRVRFDRLAGLRREDAENVNLSLCRLGLPVCPSTGEDVGNTTKKDVNLTASPDAIGPVARLYDALASQRTGRVRNARTVKLLSSGLRKMSQKLVEEAAEVAIDAVRERRDGVVSESADLLYHLVVLWFALGIDPAAVWSEMGRREQLFGLAEKLPKSRV
jgi:phosphoribosyl-ATP pyrophosphohydrolase